MCSVSFFLPTIWWWDAPKRREKIIRENAFGQQKKKPGLKFNPGLALIGLRTTGPLIFTMLLLDLAVQSSDTRTSVSNYEQTSEVLIDLPTVFWTFHMDQSGKIRRHHWKKHLKSSNIAKFESDTS